MDPVSGKKTAAVVVTARYNSVAVQPIGCAGQELGEPESARFASHVQDDVKLPSLNPDGQTMLVPAPRFR